MTTTLSSYTRQGEKFASQKPRRGFQILSKLIACGFAVAALAANAVEIIDLTAAVRAIGDSARTISASSASAPSGNYQAKGAFDGDYSANSSRSWVSDSTGGVAQWIQYQFNDTFEAGKAIHLTSYGFGVNLNWAGNSASTCRLPKSWELVGSNDGASWDVIDERSGVEFADWNSHKGVIYLFSARVNQSYRYYRFNFTGVVATDSSSQYYMIPEIMLYGELAPDEASVTKFRYWNGGSTGIWGDSSNWAPDPEGSVTVPQDGEYVWLGDKGSVTVSVNGSTAELSGMILGGLGYDVNLISTGKDVCIRGDEIVVDNKATITCADAAAEEADISRVWIACTDLMVATGGKIDVSEKGYAAPAEKAYVKGNGPGAGKKNMGASHGGYGGWALGKGNPDAVAENVPPYGDARCPVTPGSSGANSNYALGGNGGGVIRVEATGRITVDGTIVANGRGASAQGVNSTNHDTAGAGGSIWLTAHTFAGTGGTIEARGGNGDYYNPLNEASKNPIGAPGGGGRIALHYDTAAQSALPVPSVTVSVAPGYLYGETADAQFNAVTADDIMIGFEADMGTLWFSDEALPVALLPTSLTGQLVSFGKSLTLPSLMMTSGYVRFPIDGFDLKVAGDLSISGSTRLEIGGAEATNRTWRADLRTRVPVTLTVGGDLTVASGSRLDVRAAETNGTTDVAGAIIEVKGTMKVEAGSRVYAWSDVINGGSPRFTVGALVVEEGGLFSAKGRGYSGGHNMASGSNTYAVRRDEGYGPGGGKYKAQKIYGVDRWGCGGGHGGTGGTWSHIQTSGGMDNDQQYGPVLAGSGGACSQYGWCGGNGGGVIHVFATDMITIDGEINADGFSGNSECGCGAGGSILLSAPVVKGAATGLLSAKGGDSAAASSGAGAGGRILVCTGQPWEPGLRGSRRVCSAEPTSFVGTRDFFCQRTVAAGTSTPLVSEDVSVVVPATNGSCWFEEVHEPGGMMLYIR